MRTIIIWDTQVEPIAFVVLDGDYRRFNRVYINSCENENEQRELSALMYNEDSGELRQLLLSHFPVLQDGDAVIVAGFLA